MADPSARLYRRILPFLLITLGSLVLGGFLEIDAIAIERSPRHRVTTSAHAAKNSLQGPLAFPVRTALATTLPDRNPNHFGMHARLRLLDAKVDCAHVHGVVFGELPAPDFRHELFIGFMGKPGLPSPGTYDVRAKVGSCELDGGPCNPGEAVVIAGVTHVLDDGGMEFWSAVSGSVTVRDAGPHHVEAAVGLELTVDGGTPQPLSGLLDLNLCPHDGG